MTNPTNNVTQLEPPTMGQQLAPLTTRDILTDDALFNRLHKLAELMASGTITTAAHLRGNVADCFAIAMQSARWGMDPFVVSDKTFVIPGTHKIGYESQLVNAVAQTMSPIQDRFHYDYFGGWDKVTGKYREATGKSGGKYYVPTWKPQDEDGVGVTISATLRGESEPRALKLLLKQAAVRNSVQWAYDPQQQLGYLGVKKWVRRFCPDALMGVYTPDEVEPEVYMGDAEVVSNNAPAKQVAGEYIPKDKAASKSDKALNELRSRQAAEPQKPAEPTKPDVDTLILLIGRTKTLEELDLVKQKAAHLRGGARTKAKNTYQKRRAELTPSGPDEPPPHTDDDAPPLTGEVIPADNDDAKSDGTLSLTQLTDGFHEVKTIKQLEKQHPLINQFLTSETEIELAEEEYGLAMKALENKAAAAQASET